MDDTTKKETQDIWEATMGGKAPEEFNDTYLEHTGKLFREIWSRTDELGRRERRLTTLTAIAMGGAASSGVLEYHLQAAILKGDLTVEELVEWATHLCYYGGWPIGTNAYNTLQKVKAQLNK